MKKLLLILAACSTLLLVPRGLAATGTILFNNSTVTKITNAATGGPLTNGPTFRIGLYAALAGETNEANFTLAFVTNCFAPGLFNSGARPAPPIQTDGSGVIQVRVWEAAYGNSYEAAVAAGLFNGRPSQLGKSEILNVPAAGGGTTPSPSLAMLGMKAFTISGIFPPAFSINNVLVAEGSSGTAQAVFTVKLSPPSDQPVSVNFATANGSALAGSDYVATNGTVTFAPGQTNATVSVTLTPDGPVEDDEDFFVQLSNSIGAGIAQSQGRGLITEVRLYNVSVDVAVTFNTVIGHRYVVEKSDDFTTWSVVTGAENVIGTGTTATTVDRAAGCQSGRIYRARLLE